MSESLITFLRKKDYKYIRELGQGACGKTVLLLDDIIGEHFVCKKYAPLYSDMRESLFAGFMNEIKLMHRVFHPNVIRIFNYYTFPRDCAGYILMEYVEGETIDKYIAASPQSFESVFRQTIDAFVHLEQCKILHRDIRPGNILVRNDGIVKLIDLGFGKKVEGSKDYNKSITLNWLTTPEEFNSGQYDFSTEVYFVGRLFEHIITEYNIDEPQLLLIIRKMAIYNPRQRINRFSEIKVLLDKASLTVPEFSQSDIDAYRTFVNELVAIPSRIERKSTNIVDVQNVITALEHAYKNSMLEVEIAGRYVLWCFITGSFYSTSKNVYVSTLKDFLMLMKNSEAEAQRIILTNLFFRLDAVPRFDEGEIPF
jgi:serine/threonine-protein kinase